MNYNFQDEVKGTDFPNTKYRKQNPFSKSPSTGVKEKNICNNSQKKRAVTKNDPSSVM